MKKITKFILKKISRIIFWIIPEELKTNPSSRLISKLNNNLTNETFIHFEEHFNKSVLINDGWQIKKYAIQNSLLNDENKE